MSEYTEPLVSIEEAAAYLGKSRRWLYANQAELQIPRLRVGQRFRYRLSELAEWVDGKRVA